MIQDEMASQSAQEAAQEAPPARVIAELTPVGIGGFALTTFLLSCVNAKLLGQAGTWIPLAFFYGGLVQLLAGLGEARNRNLFGAMVFIAFGGGFWPALGFFFFWGTYLGLTMPGPNGQPMPVPPAAGFFLVGWTVYVVILWIASAKANLTVFLTFIVFLITLILLDIAFMAPAPGLVTVGGYAGIVLAAFAWYISAAGLINHMFGRTVIPLGGPLGESS
jgi:succinate-acetate transporter protein